MSCVSLCSLRGLGICEHLLVALCICFLVLCSALEGKVISCGLITEANSVYPTSCCFNRLGLGGLGRSPRCPAIMYVGSSLGLLRLYKAAVQQSSET